MPHRNKPNTFTLSTLALVLGSGCGFFDPGTGSSGDTGTGGDSTGGGDADETAGTDDGPAPQFPGHRVTCCFRGTFDVNGSPETHYGCQEQPRECIHEDEDLDAAGLHAFCLQKCSPGWTVSTLGSAPWTYYDPSTGAPIAGEPGTWTWFDTCAPIGPTDPAPLPRSSIFEENVCMPGEVFSYGELFDVPPTNKGAFSSGDAGNDVDIEINGLQVNANWDLSIAFALDSCDEDGVDGGECRLLLSSFDMATTGSIPVRPYVAVDAAFELNQRVAANVVFAPCQGQECIGIFEFSDALDNPIGINLLWEQTNYQTSKMSEGGLHLSNGPSGLGGLTKVVGMIEVDPDGEYGVLQLIGEGEDALGGDLASAEFDLVGTVTPL